MYLKLINCEKYITNNVGLETPFEQMDIRDRSKVDPKEEHKKNANFQQSEVEPTKVSNDPTLLKD